MRDDKAVRDKIEKLTNELTHEVLQVLKEIDPSVRRMFLAILIDKILTNSGLSTGDALAILESVKTRMAVISVLSELPQVRIISIADE